MVTSRVFLPFGLVVLTITILIAKHGTLWGHRAAGRPDLEGTWRSAMLTPLQRPMEFRDQSAFTPVQAAEFARNREARVRSRMLTDADRLTQADADDTFVETETFALDGVRTSLIVDPANGRLPPQVPAAAARIARRPKRSFDDPESVSLAERCLLGMYGLGGSTASPPMVPSEVVPAYYSIVQTDTNVMIFTEWMHDARVVRLNGTHLPPTIRSWLGDSIGHYEGDALVVDTTNFRRETHNLDSGERLHVVERFMRIDATTIRYRVTAEDPDTWTTPWTAEWPFKATDQRVFAAECHEGNRAIEGFLRGARAEERERQKP
jgi:hypothetical protein